LLAPFVCAVWKNDVLGIPPAQIEPFDNRNIRFEIRMIGLLAMTGNERIGDTSIAPTIWRGVGNSRVMKSDKRQPQEVAPSRSGTDCRRFRAPSKTSKLETITSKFERSDSSGFELVSQV